MDFIVVLGTSVILQFLAAIVALMLIPATGKRWAWVLISLSLCLMALRRGITLYAFIAEELPSPSASDVSTAWSALITSALMLAGTTRIAPLFHSIRHSANVIKASEEKYRTIFEQSRDAIYVTDGNAGVIDVNQAGLELFGYTRDEMIGMDARKLYADPAERIGLRDQLKEQGYVLDYEIKLRKKDNTEIICLLTTSVLHSPKGAILRFQGIVRDVTERKESERRTKASNAILKLYASSSSRKEYLDSAAELIRSWVGCDCAGIRLLRQDGMIPYEACTGFEPEFLAIENLLSIHTDQCVCTRGATGMFDPAEQFLLTPGKSFRCEDIMKFADTLTEGERSRLRGTCLRMGFSSVAIVPVSSGNGETMGVIHLVDREAGKISTEDVELIELMTPLIGEAIQKFTMRDELRRNTDVQELINSILRLSLTNAPLEDILEHTVDGLVAALWIPFASGAAVLLEDSDPEILVMRAERGLGEVLSNACDRVPFGECLCGRAALLQKIQFELHAGSTHDHCNSHSPLPHSHYCVPILSGSKTVGVIAMHLREDYGRNLKDDTLFSALADTLATVVQRKTIEEELGKLHRAVEQSPVMIVITNPSGVVEYANPKFIQVTGFAFDEIIGRSNYLNLDELSREERSLIWDSLRSGEEWRGEILSKTKTGESYWEFAVISALRNLDGRITHFIKVAQDITDKKRMEQQFRQTQKLEAIGTLAAGISHDFRNILGIIMGFTALAQMQVPEGTQARAYLEDVFQAAQRAKELIEQILTFARQGEQPERSPTRLSLIIKEALKFLRASVPSTIQFQSEISSESWILADPIQIHQVLVNLCTNATHAMRDNGGMLEVILHDVELDETSIAHYPGLSAGPYVELTVSDTGHGMDTGVMDRIFEPYFTTKSAGEGSGLGLAVVHGIVKSHGGMITVYSEPGRGSSFHVFFPRLNNGESGEETALSHRLEGIPTGGERILLVDDEPDLLRAVQETLSSLGYEVVAKTSSLEALEDFRSQPEKFDLVITDLTMPHMNGIELTQGLQDLRAGVPVILCSGFGEGRTMRRAKAAGVRKFLMKPVVLRDIARIVRQVLDGEE